jgi:hypothetical protein
VLADGEVRRDRQTSEGVSNWAHPLPIGGGGLTGCVAGERRRRTGGARPRALDSGEDRGGASQRVAQVASLGPRGCAEAAAGTLAPVSRWLGQANKRAQELLGVLVE